MGDVEDVSPACDNCRFGIATTFKNTYNTPTPAILCRYDPPRIEGSKGYSQFPRLHPASWCGRWECVVTPEVITETKEWADQ